MLDILASPVTLYYFLTAVGGLLPAAILLRRQPSRVRSWEWAGLIIPLAIWMGLWSIPAVTLGRKSLSNLAEPFFLGLCVGLLGVTLRWWGARLLSPRGVRLSYVIAGCIAAVLVALFTPMLPE